MLHRGRHETTHLRATPHRRRAHHGGGRLALGRCLYPAPQPDRVGQRVVLEDVDRSSLALLSKDALDELIARETLYTADARAELIRLLGRAEGVLAKWRRLDRLAYARAIHTVRHERDPSQVPVGAASVQHELEAMADPEAYAKQRDEAREAVFPGRDGCPRALGRRAEHARRRPASNSWSGSHAPWRPWRPAPSSPRR
jgi:hypothetical protein